MKMKKKNISWIGIILITLITLIVIIGTTHFILLNHQEGSKENQKTLTPHMIQNETSQKLIIDINPHYKKHNFRIDN